MICDRGVRRMAFGHIPFHYIVKKVHYFLQPLSQYFQAPLKQVSSISQAYLAHPQVTLAISSGRGCADLALRLGGSCTKFGRFPQPSQDHLSITNQKRTAVVLWERVSIYMLQKPAANIPFVAADYISTRIYHTIFNDIKRRFLCIPFNITLPIKEIFLTFPPL